MMNLFWLLMVFTVHAAPCMDGQQCSSCGSNGLCISQCNDGYFGLKCKQKCRAGCIYNICHMNNNGNDECTHGCKLGYYGSRCIIPCATHENTCKKCPQECEEGFCQLGSSCAQGCQDSYYGTACKSCPAWCEVCNRVSGTCEVCLHCEGDCTQGCLEECEDGYFGKFCEHNCSSKCASGCDKISGNCFSCKLGLFGHTCEKRCPDRCIDEACDIDGVCTHGCTEGWYGSRCECLPSCAGGRCDRNGKCTDGCRLGFYGEQCQNNCSVNCFNTLCDIEDGSCKSCKKGFYGSHCDKSCFRCTDGDCQDTGLCANDDCREVCKTYHETETVLDDVASNYIPYIVATVAAVFVVIVSVLVIYAACRFKRLQRVIYGSMKKGQEQQRQRDLIEAAPEPTVNFYYEVDADAATSPQFPRPCGAQVAPVSSPPSQQTSSQTVNNEAAVEEGASNIPVPYPPSQAEADASVTREKSKSDGVTVYSVQPEPTRPHSYLTPCVPNIDIGLATDAASAILTKPPGTDKNLSRKEDLSSLAEPQRCANILACRCVPVSESLPQDTTEYEKDGIVVQNIEARGHDGPLAKEDSRELQEEHARAHRLEEGSFLNLKESAEDDETDVDLSNISVPVIADCYDNFSVDDVTDETLTPPPDNYSKLFTMNYGSKTDEPEN